LREKCEKEGREYVTYEEAEAYAESENILFLEVSALTDHNIDSSMRSLVTGSLEAGLSFGKSTSRVMNVIYD